MNPVDNSSVSGDSAEIGEGSPLNYTPGPNALDISPGKNGKLWKEIIRPSSEEHGVCEGMEVKVHYVGTLPDGTEFDRSDKTSTPFTFVVGDGKVIRAWDVGIVGMKKGEICKLICHPDLAYGKKATGSIPPNSTLIFEVEMVDFVPEDLTRKKTGQIVRYRLVAGQSKYLFPNNGSLIEVCVKGRYKDKVIFPVQTLNFNLGEGSEVGLPRGVEKALFKFSTGESSIIAIKGLKYGPAQSVYDVNGIPHDATLEYEVELKSMDNAKEAWQMEGSEKLEAARNLKEKGGKFFSNSNFRLAAKHYKRIVDFLKAEALLNGEEEDERKALLLAAYLNQAISNIKLNKPVLAIRNCDDALDMSPNNPKGLYRRGLAQLAINEPIEAKADFCKLLELEPNNKAAIQQINLCEKKMKEHKLKEKQIYSKMFEKLGKMDKAVEKPLPNGMDNVCEWEKPGSGGSSAPTSDQSNIQES